MMFYVTAFSTGWLRGKGLEYREENRPLSGQQHQAQFGINPALDSLGVKLVQNMCYFWLNIPPWRPKLNFFSHRFI